MKKMIVALILTLVSLGAAAQTTTVTATVVDSDTTIWANGAWSLTFVPNQNYPSLGQYSIGGSPLLPSITNQTGTMNGSGVISLSTYNSTMIVPQGSSWKLQVCPNASAPCGTYNFATSGSTLDISTGVNSVISAPRFTAVAGHFGYGDGEITVTTFPGGQYYNVTTPCMRVWNGSVFGCLAGGGTGAVNSVNPGTGCVNISPTTGSVVVNVTCTTISGGTQNVLSKFNSAGTNIVNSLATDNGTELTYSGSGGINASGGPLSAGATPPTACGSATGCIAFGEASIAGTPTTGQGYIRADSTTNELLYSINGGAEANLVNAGGINQLTGDATAGPGSGSQAVTFAIVNSNTGTCGDATHVGQVTLNGKGLTTACTAVAITANAGIASVQITLPTGAIAANTCNSYSTVTMTGVATTTTFSFSPASDATAVTGWGANGGLVIASYPTSNTLHWTVCNQTSGSITPGALTANVSAR